MHTTSQHFYMHWPYLFTIPHSSFASKSGANHFYTPSPLEFVYDVYQRHYQFSQIICREVYGQFNPCRRLGKTLFSVNFHPLLHSNPLSLSAPLQCGVSFCLFFYITAFLFFPQAPTAPPKNPQTACSLCKSLAFYSQFSSSALNETSRKHTHTHSLVLTTLYCSGNRALHDILMHYVPQRSTMLIMLETIILKSS